MFSVTLEEQGWSFDAAEDQTLLEAASRSGVILPSSCRNGTCRTCMCRLANGQIVYKIEWPGLSFDEKQEGYILPCVAYPRSDLAVCAPAASRLA